MLIELEENHHEKSRLLIAQTAVQADRIVEQLQVAGFANNDISVLFPDKSSTKDFAHEKATKAPEGAATGGTVGAGVGAALGWLAGSAAWPFQELDPSLPPVQLWGP